MRWFCIPGPGFIAIFGVGPVTVFIWKVVTFWKDWMNTDVQREQFDGDSFLSMVSDPGARASDETAEDVLQSSFSMNL